MGGALGSQGGGGGAHDVSPPSRAMILLAPEFVLDDPAQGVKGWKLTLHDMPDLTGSPRQIKWAKRIRYCSLHQFIDAMLRQGGDQAITARHWWTPDLQKDVRDAQLALNAELVPLLNNTIDSREWINALDWDRNVHDAGIVVRLLQSGKRDA